MAITRQLPENNEGENNGEEETVAVISTNRRKRTDDGARDAWTRCAEQRRARRRACARGAVRKGRRGSRGMGGRRRAACAGLGDGRLGRGSTRV
jgi:hypothetical protein